VIVMSYWLISETPVTHLAEDEVGNQCPDEEGRYDAKKADVLNEHQISPAPHEAHPGPLS
jgi:hypothetical protein